MKKFLPIFFFLSTFAGSYTVTSTTSQDSAIDVVKAHEEEEFKKGPEPTPTPYPDKDAFVQKRCGNALDDVVVQAKNISGSSFSTKYDSASDTDKQAACEALKGTWKDGKCN